MVSGADKVYEVQPNGCCILIFVFISAPYGKLKGAALNVEMGTVQLSADLTEGSAPLHSLAAWYEPSLFS